MIPATRRAPCALCGEDLDVEVPGVYQWTSGWVMRRDGGGGHSVALPERAAKWAHGACVDRATRGLLNEKQSELFR